MKFLLDHDVPDEIQYPLTALGHEVVKVREVMPSNASDEDVLRWATTSKSILLTCNRDDFLALARQVTHSGVIVLIRRRTRAHERAALVHLLDKAGEQGLCGNINFA